MLTTKGGHGQQSAGDELTAKGGHGSAGEDQQSVGNEKGTQRNIWVTCFPGQRQGNWALLPSVGCMKGM